MTKPRPTKSGVLARAAAGDRCPRCGSGLSPLPKGIPRSKEDVAALPWPDGVGLCMRDRDLYVTTATHLVGETWHILEDDHGIHYAWHRLGNCPWGVCAPPPPEART